MSSTQTYSTSTVLSSKTSDSHLACVINQSPVILFMNTIELRIVPAPPCGPLLSWRSTATRQARHINARKCFQKCLEASVRLWKLSSSYLGGNCQNPYSYRRILRLLPPMGCKSVVFLRFSTFELQNDGFCKKKPMEKQQFEAQMH